MKFYILFASVFMFAFITISPLQAQANTSGPNTADIVAEMNRDRASRGLSALGTNPILSQAAHARSQVLARDGRIYHLTSPNGTPWPELWNAGYKYTFAGENLALGIETPQDLEARWMDSPTHRENILNGSYEDVGVGVTVGTYQGRPASYVVVFFGKKRPETAVVLSQAVPTSSMPSAPSVVVPGAAVTQGVQAVRPVQTTVASVTVESSLQSGASLPTQIVLPASSEVSPAAAENAERMSLLTKLVTLLQYYAKLVSVGSA